MGYGRAREGGVALNTHPVCVKDIHNCAQLAQLRAIVDKGDTPNLCEAGEKTLVASHLGGGGKGRRGLCKEGWVGWVGKAVSLGSWESHFSTKTGGAAQDWRVIGMGKKGSKSELT